MKKQPLARSAGRPRAFDEEKALDAAMRVFWREGYEAASLSALTDAMGINRPSLYAVFGGKKELFLRTLDRYESGPAGFVTQALREPSARTAVERLLQGAADLATNPETPKGCLLVQGALGCGDGCDGVRKELNRRRDAAEKALRVRLQRARKEGDLPDSVDVNNLTRYVMTLMRGLAVQAAGGTRRRELRGVIETAMRAWPS